MVFLFIFQYLIYLDIGFFFSIWRFTDFKNDMSYPKSFFLPFIIIF